MRWLLPLRALWAVIYLLTGQPSMATEWTLVDSSVHTTNGAADMPDMLAIAGPWGTVTFPFNRSRTPVDVLDGSQDGSIRLPGLVLSADAHRVLRRPTRSRLPLDALTDITTSGRRITIHRGTRHCVIHLPAGWKIEDMRAERLPRDVAASARAALLLARGSTSDSLLPTRVDLSSCKVKTGQRIRQIGFDALLQGHVGGWWLTSTAENMLLISKDGMHWTDLTLPQATHALLGAHVTPDGQTWIAVSQADIGFRLQAYRWEGPAHGWAQAAMSEAPHTWVDFARLAAEDRLSPQSHEAPQR